MASAAQTQENFALFGAPHVAILTVDATLGVYGAVDTGLYIGSFLLAAHALGRLAAALRLAHRLGHVGHAVHDA